jgi:hypothetical protein
MNFPLLNSDNVDQLKEIVVEAMLNPHSRYGFEHAWICEEVDGTIKGMLFGNPGVLEVFVDSPLEVALVKHSYPVNKVKEANESLPGSWHLDAVVSRTYF